MQIHPRLRNRNRPRRGAGLQLAVLALGMIAMLAAPGPVDAAERALTDVEHAQLPGERVRITLTLSGPAPEPDIFTVNRPARLSLDLPDTTLAIDKHRYRIDVGSVRALVFAEGDHRTRMVVRLSRMVPYETSVSGNRIQIILGAAGAPRFAGADHRGPHAGTPTTRTGAHPSIKDVGFRRTATGAGRVTVTLAETQGPVNIARQGRAIVATFRDARLPESLVRRLDVIDFATPVKYVDAFNTAQGARIRVIPIEGADFEQIAYRVDNRFVLALQPVTAAERRVRETNQQQYNGKRISLSVQNAEIRNLLHNIAQLAGVNMVIGESVSGTMALQLQNVPWDLALDIILTTQGLGMRRMGNVILVAPLAEIAKLQHKQLKARKATENLAPLTTELIQVNYANAEEIKKLLKSSAVSFVSKRGAITVDERTNTLLIRETRENLAEIRRIIEQLDVPLPQVLVEARLVVANRNFARSLGVRFSASDQGSIESPSGGTYLTDTGFSVSLPVAAPTGTLSTSIIGNTFNLSLELTAMESEGRGEIISAPRVITTAGHKATISQGVEIPFVNAGQDGPSVEFKEAKLKLTVTPRITPNGKVSLDLTVTQDSVGDLVPTASGLVPSINTRKLTTHLMVDNGETVVLGGIYKQTDRETVRQVPVLGDIPLIGALFQTTAVTHKKRELLIFITPTIVRQELAASISR